jgi:hypothetical protein
MPAGYVPELAIALDASLTTIPAARATDASESLFCLYVFPSAHELIDQYLMLCDLIKNDS